MGLDVYFYRKPKPVEIKSGREILEDTKTSANTEWIAELERLKQFADTQGETVENLLVRAIQSFLISHDDTKEEVGYFRKFWWIIRYFGYTEDDYAQDRSVTKDQLEELHTLSKKTLMMVEKMFTDKGLIIEDSPLNYSSFSDSSRYGKQPKLSFTNSVFTEDMEEEADTVCYSVFETEDSMLYHKVVDLYLSTTEILNSTDWDKQQIVLNADW